MIFLGYWGRVCTGRIESGRGPETRKWSPQKDSRGNIQARLLSCHVWNFGTVTVCLCFITLQ